MTANPAAPAVNAYHLQCIGCGEWAIIGPDKISDPDPHVVCGCCPKDHHHGQAAECSTDHSSHPCPHPDPAACMVDGTGRGESPDEPCAGGHCGLGVEDCNVCRPIVITALAGAAVSVPDEIERAAALREVG
jgi:hypothetical protein